VNPKDVIEAIANADSQALSIYSSFDPAKATGPALDKLKGVSTDAHPIYCRLGFNVDEVKAQLDELAELVWSRFPEEVPDDLFNDILRLASDIVLTSFTTATGADGTEYACQSIKLGSSFDDFLAAFRADKVIGHDGQLSVTQDSRLESSAQNSELQQVPTSEGQES
jgi:hypothetical protein